MAYHAYVILLLTKNKSRCVMDKRLSFFRFVCSRTLNGNSVHNTVHLKKKQIYRVLNGVYNFVRVCPNHKRVLPAE